MPLHASRHRRNKAVAEGAVSFYLRNVVSVRIAKVTYGVKCTATFDARNPDHVLRQHSLRTRPSGEISVDGAFKVLLGKVGASVGVHDSGLHRGI